MKIKLYIFSNNVRWETKIPSVISGSPLMYSPFWLLFIYYLFYCNEINNNLYVLYWYIIGTSFILFSSSLKMHISLIVKYIIHLSFVHFFFFLIFAFKKLFHFFFYLAIFSKFNVLIQIANWKIQLLHIFL